jgi:DNA adenine methylase
VTSDPQTPFLKWPGGKRWLSSRVAPILAAELSKTYFEPFLGAAAMYLALRPKAAVLGDTNGDLMQFLSTIREQPNEVVEHVWRFSNTQDCYYRVRASRPTTAIGQAARFLFLNRTCWGGVYRLNRNGEFNVPFGGSGRTICRRQDVLAVSNALRDATFLVGDFSQTIGNAAHGDVIYCDPPYTTKGAGNGFIRYNESLFSWADQSRLAREARSARRRGAFVAVSGLDHVEILDLYSGWWVARFKRHSLIGRAITSRRRISEVVIFSRRPTERSDDVDTIIERIP